MSLHSRAKGSNGATVRTAAKQAADLAFSKGSAVVPCKCLVAVERHSEAQGAWTGLGVDRIESAGRCCQVIPGRTLRF